MNAPKQIALIGNEVAIQWQDGTEDYYPMEFLRRHSPSADNAGEKDLLGNTYGGDPDGDHTGVLVKDWQIVGGYAVQFHFSDGHSTGLFSYEYLARLAGFLKEAGQ